MKKMLFLFAAALMMVACNNDNEPVVNNDNLINEITLAIEKSETRTVVTNDAEGMKFEWKENDAVYVFPAESGNTTNVVFCYDPETGKFTSGASLTEGTKYFAIFGKSQIANYFNQDGIKAAMQLGVSPLLTNLPMVSDVFTATADGTFATLHHISSVVEIPITGTEGKQIYDIEFNVYNSTSGDKKAVGKADVTFDENGIINGITKGTASNPSSTCAQYDESSPLTLSSTPQSIFIPILPGTYNNILIQYKVVGGDTESTTMRKDEFTFVRGKLHKKSSAVDIVIEE